MTNPRDPEGLMPDADVAGPPPDGSLGPSGDPGNRPFPGPATDTEPGPETAAGSGQRTDVDELGSDPEVRFPGASDDPTMTTADARFDTLDPDPEDRGTDAGRY